MNGINKTPPINNQMYFSKNNKKNCPKKKKENDSDFKTILDGFQNKK